MKRHLLGVAAAVLGTVLISGAGFAAATAAAAPVPTTVTLPMFGAPLTLDVTTDPGGALTNVAVDSANPTVATKLKPHKVVFQVSSLADPTADPGRVVVKSRHGGQSVSARAGSLADVSGPGAWSGDVFGTGTATSVAFTVAAAADGTSPDITGVTSSDATAVIGTVDHSTGDGHDHEGDASSARVSVKFTNAAGDQSRSLSIRVEVRTGGEHDSAKLSISLSPIKGVAIDAATAAGPHTWSGLLCDGTTTATVSYTVAADGSVSAVTATPATAVVKTDGDKISVKFSDTERVLIMVHAKDGMIKIQAMTMFRCNSGNPVTNVSTSIPTPDNGGGNGHFGGSGRGDHKGGKNG
jgi:hypothetical protein